MSQQYVLLIVEPWVLLEVFGLPLDQRSHNAAMITGFKPCSSVLAELQFRGPWLFKAHSFHGLGIYYFCVIVPEYRIVYYMYNVYGNMNPAGFGVSSKLWDVPFGTLPKDTRRN